MTLMPQNSEILKDARFLSGNAELILNSGGVPALGVCSKEVLDFFDALSRILMTSKKARAFSDVIAWAFWIRRASLEKLAKRFADTRNLRLGRGFAFHIAPSNVPVNFAVSMTSSLLAGNITAVRVPSRDFAQIGIISDAINSLMDEGFEYMRPYIALMRYGHDKSINDYLSARCDLRVVWGGDATVAEIRTSPLPARAIELEFPDRYSLCFINSDEYLKQDPKRIAELFYTDTYYSDQNACSSPRALVWLGSSRDEARERFYDALYELVKKRYHMDPILAVDKLNAFCELAASGRRPRLCKKDNTLVRVKVQSVDEALMDYKMSGGYFFDYDAQTPEDALPLMGKRCQSVSCLGIEPEKIAIMALRHGVRGIDRVVRMGHTMDLSFIWDGFDMVSAMSRVITVG